MIKLKDRFKSILIHYSHASCTLGELLVVVIVPPVSQDVLWFICEASAVSVRQIKPCWVSNWKGVL